MSVNVPSIPASVNAQVRQAIAALKDEVIALQAANSKTTSTVAMTTTVSTGIPEAPLDGQIYVRRNGTWEVLNIVG